MSIDRFFKTSFTVERMEWSGESGGNVSAGSFSGHIQQAQPDFAQHIGEAWGLTFVAWCRKGTDVEPGDTLTIASGDYAGTYSVKNVQIHAVGLNEHMALTIIQDIE